MWIDNVSFQPIQPLSGLIGFASVNIFLDEEVSLYLGNMAVYTIKNRPDYRITYPTRKSRGNHLTIFKPSHKLARKIKDIVLSEVRKTLLGDMENEDTQDY